ncbi:MAG TPA: T9SS type A sorting domain-containing protein [Mucilaginibacter sp.]|nr:T9SS type A sorting domain-containing protein [Mucilaginibacter sp.]
MGTVSDPQLNTVAISADGNTVIFGASNENDLEGAAWIFTRIGNVWVQQGNKLVGTGNIGVALQGVSVAISADGNTAIVGGTGDDNSHGAAWIFVRSGDGTWTQQGTKLIGTGGSGVVRQGSSVALSADGNTALIGGFSDFFGEGGVWVFLRDGNTWTQQGAKLVGTGGSVAEQGSSVAINGSGNTTIIGGDSDNLGVGAAWIFTAQANTPPGLNVSLIDPYPDMVGNDGNLLTTMTIKDFSHPVIGAATDGVSKILLVAKSDVPVTFTLSDAKDGSLSALDGTTNGLSMTVQPVSGLAVAVYTSPDGYGLTNPAGGRYINVQAKDINDDIVNTSIKLVTPPVVLVHGMWSDPQAWIKGGFKEYLTRSGIRVIELADYYYANNQTFDPKNPESELGKDAIWLQRYNAYFAERALGIVAVQADYVGHSLGGLQIRNFSQDPAFIMPLNYNKGFIHKLITIGTPHLGSMLGPILYYGTFSPVKFRSTFLSNIKLIPALFDMPIGSVQKDFDPNFKNTGKGLDNLTATTLFKVHAIEARWDAPGPEASNGWTKYLSILYNFYQKRNSIISNTALSVIFKDTSSDLIVPRYSQLGGLTDSKFYDHYDYTTHTDVLGLNIPGDVSELKNAFIQSRVSDLLLTDDPTVFAPGFPASNAVKTPFDNSIVQPVIQSLAKPKVNVGLKSILYNNADSINSAKNNVLQILKPTAADIFKNDGKDSLTLSLQFTDPSKLASSVFIVKGVGFIAMPDKAPYIAKIVLPNSVSPGKLSIAALGMDIYGNLFADTLSTNIQSVDTLRSIKINYDTVQLDTLSRTVQLNVTGLYVSGKDSIYRNITSAQAETSYSLILKNATVSVSNDGLISGLKGGKDTVLIKNQALTAKVPVNVDQSLLKVAKFPNIINLTISDKTYGDPPFVLNGSSSSGAEVTYKLMSGPVSISNNVVTIAGPGRVKIIASCAGDAYFNAAPDDTVSFNVLNFTLPANNFTISTTSATCKDVADGTINIAAAESLNYTATITGGSPASPGQFTTNDTVKNLAAGTYHICITVQDQPGYQQCYDLTVDQPKALSVYSTINDIDKTVTLMLNNGASYFIQLNGVSYTTTNNSITLPLKDGDNALSITTEKLCQGTFQSVINLLKKIVPFPDPFENMLSVNLGNEPVAHAFFEVHDMGEGKILYTKQMNNQLGVVQLDLSNLKEGVYALYIKLDNTQRIYKIIKK